MAKRTIILVGRASRLQCLSDHVSFLLTVKGKGQRPELVVECQAHHQLDIERSKAMDNGSLVGVIGTLSPITEQDENTIVMLDRLEILGKPQGVAA